MSEPFRLRGFHVAVIVVSFFGSVMAVNFYFVARALDTFPGEDEPKSYAQGLHYNDTLRDRALQAALGWRAEASIAQNAAGGAEIEVRLFDRAGAPLTNLALTGVLRRPTDAKLDLPLTFRAEGDHYVAAAPHIVEGSWTLHARAAEGERHFDLGRSLVWRRLPA